MLIRILVISLFIFFSCSKKPTGPEEDIQHFELSEDEEKLVFELNKIIFPLAGASPYLNNSDLSVFDQFSNAQVIGLGEATHGTKEFFQMKHRIFKYLVENYGYKIFGFEADMGECIYIDRFITKGIGTINSVMQKMHFWTWQTLEVENLILWMKEYNEGKNEQDQIHFLGVDCQATTYNKKLIIGYLNAYDNNYPSYIDTILSEICSITYQQGNTIDPEEKLLLKDKCDSIQLYFELNSSSLIANSGQYEYDIISRLIEQSKQFLDVITDNSYNYRDYYMAQNTIWLTNLLGEQTKVVSWAHNLHLSKEPGILFESQGYVLSQALGTNYKAIGFSFNQGKFRAVNFIRNPNTYKGLIVHTISQIPLRESYNYIFYASIPTDFILICSDVTNSNLLFSWFNTNRKFMSIGAIYNIDYYSDFYLPINLYLAFDAIIHFENTTNAIEY